jgi:protein-disulfide isomerase
MTSETKVVSVIVLVTLVIIGGGLWLASKQGGSYAEDLSVQINSETLIRAETPRILATIQSSTTVSIVEFADLECPACAMLHPNIKQVLAKHTSDVNYYYRTVPIHAGSHEVATYALAAGKQGKFFEFADVVFSKQPTWSIMTNRTKAFEEYAAIAGANVEQLRKDLSDATIKRVLADDKADALSMGINSTPTLIINNRVVKGVTSVAELEKIIAEEKAELMTTSASTSTKR